MTREMLRASWLVLTWVLLLPLVGACLAVDPEPQGPLVLMDFGRSGGLFTAPFPSVELQSADGHLDLAAFPGRGSNALFDRILLLGEEDMDGAGVNSAVYFRLGSAADPEALPTVHESVTSAAPVFLMDVDPVSPDYLQRLPVWVDFRVDGGAHGTRNQLSILPLQGVPLRPGTRYAAVITRALALADARRLGVHPSLASLRRGEGPEGLAGAALDDYLAALSALDEAGVAGTELAGLAVFRTADPLSQTQVVYEHLLASPLPVPDATFTLEEVFDDYCTFHSTITLPTFQEGNPPYTAGGGRWVFDAQGQPLQQALETANFWITVPRQAAPSGGFPVVVFVRTGGGGERPLVERGPSAEAHGDPIAAGTGPALHFARAGWAGVSVDGPHGGLRNVTGGDEQFLMFNITNPAALRDNIRQSAVELALLAQVLGSLTIDASGCPEVGDASSPTPVAFDTEQLALMGHSMGATIAPLVLFLEPAYQAVILSGAGGSWIENVMDKLSPLEVRPLVELMLNRPTGSLYRQDPAVNALQWAADSADPLSYLRAIREAPFAVGGQTREPVQVLMLQGIVDTYIMPSIANAMSLGLALDLAGPALDVDHPELASFTPLGSLLDLVGAAAVSLPIEGNRQGPGGVPYTAVVVQHPEDGIQDGHEVVFQTTAPQLQYGCFLKTLRETGLGYVPAGPGDPRCL